MVTQWRNGLPSEYHNTFLSFYEIASPPQFHTINYLPPTRILSLKNLYSLLNDHVYSLAQREWKTSDLFRFHLISGPSRPCNGKVQHIINIIHFCPHFYVLRRLTPGTICPQILWDDDTVSIERGRNFASFSWTTVIALTSPIKHSLSIPYLSTTPSVFLPLSIPFLIFYKFFSLFKSLLKSANFFIPIVVLFNPIYLYFYFLLSFILLAMCHIIIDFFPFIKLLFLCYIFIISPTIFCIIYVLHPILNLLCNISCWKLLT